MRESQPEDTESLMEERAYDTFGRSMSRDQVNNAETKKRRSNFTTLSLLAAVGVSVLVLLYLTVFSGSSSSTDVSLSTKSSSSTKKGSGSSNGTSISRPDYLKMNLYKHTAVVTTGTSTLVAALASLYIAPLIETSDMGCTNTFKEVFDLKHPSGNSAHFAEFHFLDSSRFTQTGKSFSEWADYVGNMGTDVFNVYMHNKLQMYSPDPSLVFRKLLQDGAPGFFHLSMSPGSDTYDVAHVGILIKEAITIYEIVGPITNFNESELAMFSPWNDGECGTGNNIKKTLTEYQGIYDGMTETGEERAWVESTGLYVPMAIAVHTSVSSLDRVASHVTAGALISDGTMTTEVISDSCRTLTVDFDRSKDDGVDGYNAIIRYVENTAAYQGQVFSLSDWEDEVEASHAFTLNAQDSAGYNSWNHYLDHHIGIITEAEPDQVNYCTESRAYIEGILEEYDLKFAPRSKYSTHYFTGTDGILVWEFNIEACNYPDKYDFDLCGCLASNNNMEYQAIYNSTCLVTTTSTRRR